MEVNLVSLSVIASKGSKYRNTGLEADIKSLNTGDGFGCSEQQLTELDMPILIDQAIYAKELTILILSDNEINEKAIKLLAEALEDNMTLRELNLMNNPVDSGVNLLAKCLHTNKILTILNLSATSIDDNGAQSLAEMLQNNNTLLELSLGDNHITSKGVRYFTEALHGSLNSTLEKLDLDENPIDDSCINDLIHMLKYNKVLQKLQLYSSELSEEGRKKLRDATKRKKNFDLLVVEGVEIEETDRGSPDS